jgi:hypothetical protein
MQDTILDVLASLLLVPGELQGEAAGALRNLTLDGTHVALWQWWMKRKNVGAAVLNFVSFFFLSFSFSVSDSVSFFLSSDLRDGHLEAFAQTKAIDNLMQILGTLNVGPRVTCILNSIRNLSLKGTHQLAVVVVVVVVVFAIPCLLL